MHLLVTGGVRSGKSRFAQEQAEQLADRRVFLATGRAWDDEMGERIKRHQDDRDTTWRTIEEPIRVWEHLDQPGCVVLLDCLTMWLTNILLEEIELEPAIVSLEEALAAVGNPVVLVTNEVGWGIVPQNALARRFRDEAGRLSQRLARVCDRVVLVAAGLPLELKGSRG